MKYLFIEKINKRIIFSLFLVIFFPIFRTEAVGINSSLPNFGADSLKTGLIGYWTFDGANMKSNVTDSSNNSASGFLINFSATSTVVGVGKMGQSLRFDGINDYVSVSAVKAIGTLGTFCAWVNPNTSAVQQAILTSAGISDTTHELRFSLNSISGSLYPIILSNNGGTADWVRTTNSVPSNSWSHVCATGNGSIYQLFINGVKETLVIGQGSNTGKWFSAISGRANYKIGLLTRSTGDVIPFNGRIDDLRVYDRVLSNSEIKQIYNLGNSKINETLPNFGGDSLKTGLVGYWTFDGANMKSNVADVSGNSNKGNMTNFAATSTVVTPGKLGQALRFDGSNDRVVINDMTVLEGSSKAAWSFWFKPDTVSSEKVLIAKWNSDSSETSFLITTGNGSGSKIQMYMDSASVDGTLSSSVLSVGKWTHVVIVYDGSQATNDTKLNMYIDGTAQSLTFNGTIPSTIPATASNMNLGGFSNGGVTIGYTTGALDDVRMYNRILNATEIKQIYNLGNSKFNKPLPNFGGDSLKTGLVGYWTFDGANMKSNVADVSGNSNNGSMTNFAATSTVVTFGKLGQALKFDGVDDLVSIPSSSSVNDLPSLTISFWAKPESLGVSRTNVAKADNASGGHGWRVGSGSVTASIFSFSVPGFTGGDLQTSSGSGAFVAGQWAHYVATWDGTNQARGVHLYKNGVELAATYTDAGTATLQSDSLRNIVLGRESGMGDNFFNGIMDDVRLYDRVLSVSEIKQLYKLGM